MFVIFGERVPLPVAVMLLGAFVLMVTALRLRTILFLAIATLLLSTLTTELTATARLARWPFLVALVVKGAASGLATGFLPRPMRGPQRILILFTILAVASAAWSISAPITLAQAGMTIVMFMAVFLVLWNNWRTTEDIQDICVVLYRVAALLFVAEFVQLASDPAAAISRSRYAGLFNNPNGLGLAATFFLPFVYWRYRTVPTFAGKVAAAILAGMVVTALVLSGSRSGLLGTAVCMGYILTQIHRSRMVLVVLFVLVPLGTFVLFGETIGRTEIEESRLVRRESLANLSDRLPLWEQGLALVAERPLLGYGFGMSRFADIGAVDTTIQQALYYVRGINYHSTHLQAAIEVGIVGLGLFWAYSILMLRYGFRLFFDSDRSALHLTGVVYFGVFLALFGDSFVHGWAFSPGNPNAILFWLTGAAAARVYSMRYPAAREDAAEDACPPAADR